MTKADLISEITKSTGVNKNEVDDVVEAFMKLVKNSLTKGDNVYLRGFGTFQIKRRASKTARNISKNTTVIVPEHNVPFFKPATGFVDEIKKTGE